MTNPNDARIEEQLSHVFGSYRAEGLKERIFEFFNMPDYFMKLVGPHPCFLMGGRGTGKTTVLRLLAYEGQFARNNRDIDSISSWPYYGLYRRINLNRVNTFQGPELSEKRWERVFAHYINLFLSHSILEFLEWYTRKTGITTDLHARSYKKIAASLHLEECNNNTELIESLDEARIRFEAYINNVGDESDKFRLSMQGAPIDAIAEAVLALPEFYGKTFYFIIDEYESLLPYQQRIFNTLIKHSGSMYSFKVGVKEEGIKAKETLNADEKLETPADYDLIKISEQMKDSFEHFALQVCNDRLSHLPLLSIAPEDIIKDVRSLLPELSEEDEAVRLGAVEQVKIFRRSIERELSAQELHAFDQLTPLEAYFLKYWSDGRQGSPVAIVRESLNDERKWRDRFSNYKHACLFTLGRKKTDIKKYYAGWRVFLHLSDTNIRRLLQLVDRSLSLHIKQEGNLSRPVPPEVQTRSAVSVAEHNLTELEGLAAEGKYLRRLVLGLGQIFHLLAEDSAGHAPEVNQFTVRYTSSVLATSDETNSFSDRLLTLAVMHLALLRSKGTKLSNQETMEYDYIVHPIFCPYFVFSYRRKRKLRLSEADIVGLVNDPSPVINRVLRQSNRLISDVDSADDTDDLSSSSTSMLSLFEEA